MTENGEKMLICLYGVFKEKNKTEDIESAKYMTPSEIAAKCNAVFHSGDIDGLLAELENNDYISHYSTGDVELKDSAIEYVEKRPKEKLKDIIDFLSKFF